MSVFFSWFRRGAVALLLLAIVSLGHAQPAVINRTPIIIGGLGKGTAALKGPWRFHLGDNPAWSGYDFNDSDWVLVSADRPWGEQGYQRYTGYAWYRCRLTLSPAPGVPPEFSLLLERVDDAYEVYWNGKLIGHNGRLEPYRIWYFSQPPQIFAMGSVGSGVLAIRVWKAPLFSDDSGQGGGFESVPLIGSPDAIATAQAALNYAWLHSRQFLFGQNLLYGVIALLSCLAWIRNRSRWLLFWTMAFTAAPPAILLLLQSNIPWPYPLAVGAVQPFFAIQDLSLWFLLLWLLPIRQIRGLRRLTRILAGISITTATLDGVLLAISWGPRWRDPAQLADGAAAFIFTLLDAFPLFLIAVAFRQRKGFDLARWLIAISAFLYDMIFVIRNAAKQGRQFTDWTLANRIDKPLFTIGGSAITLLTLAGALLLAAIVYAVYRGVREDQRQKDALEREKVELTRTREQMRHYAEHDGLTGLWNHRVIIERLREEVERSRREATQLSIILADIDHFKGINDTLGHLTGDAVLKEIARIFRHSVRGYDSVGRYGGEEFLIILPGSGFESACLRAEDLRLAVQSAPVRVGETTVRVTSSFGVAAGLPADSEAETVIRTADAALYQAKKNGRNCVVAMDIGLSADTEVPAVNGQTTETLVE